MRVVFWTTSASLLLASTVCAQTSTRRLVEGFIELSHPFRQITDVRELSDGRVIVVDALERLVQVADFKASQISQIGRQGFDSGAYLWPDRLIALPGDTTLVHDAIEGRLHVIPANRVNANSAGRDLLRWVPRVVGGSKFHTQFADAEGGFYREIQVVGRTDPTTKRELPSGFALERWIRGTARFDTLAFSASSSGFSARPFPVYNRWAVSTDGYIARIQAITYHVDVFAPNGSRTASRTIEHNRIPVSTEVKKAWQAFAVRPQVLYVSMGDRRYGFREEAQDYREPDEWPTHLPAVMGRGAFFSLDPILWIERSSLESGLSEYDVLDTRADVIMKVYVDKGSRIAGFGRGVVYVARHDVDGREYLRRYPAPHR